MIWQIAATIAILSVVIGNVVQINDMPYPWDTPWKTNVAGLCGIAFLISLPTALISFIWSMM